jgi:hypothetical protein
MRTGEAQWGWVEGMGQARARGIRPRLVCGLVALLAAGAAHADEATCRARVRECLQPTACTAGQSGHCWTNRCGFAEYLVVGTPQRAAPLKPGEVLASSLDDAFKPDPKHGDRRVLDCEDPESAQAISVLPAGSAGAAPPAGTAAPAQAVATTTSAAASPREHCGKRVFLALVACLQVTCHRPEYTGHPECKGYEATR